MDFNKEAKIDIPNHPQVATDDEAEKDPFKPPVQPQSSESQPMRLTVEVEELKKQEFLNQVFNQEAVKDSPKIDPNPNAETSDSNVENTDFLRSDLDSNRLERDSNMISEISKSKIETQQEQFFSQDESYFREQMQKADNQKNSEETNDQQKIMDFQKKRNSSNEFEVLKEEKSDVIYVGQNVNYKDNESPVNNQPFDKQDFETVKPKNQILKQTKSSPEKTEKNRILLDDIFQNIPTKDPALKIDTQKNYTNDFFPGGVPLRPQAINDMTQNGPASPKIRLSDLDLFNKRDSRLSQRGKNENNKIEVTEELTTEMETVVKETRKPKVIGGLKNQIVIGRQTRESRETLGKKLPEIKGIFLFIILIFDIFIAIKFKIYHISIKVKFI